MADGLAIAVTTSRRRAWALTLVATFTMAISYVDRQVLAVLAPTVTAALQIDEIAYGFLASAFSLAYLVGAPIAGRIVDATGARRGLLGAVIVWSIVAAAHAGAVGFVSLLMLRIALGLAEAPSFPGAAQTVQRALPPAERARGFGVLFTGSSIGAMIAAPLATTLEAKLGWRLAFLTSAIVGLVWIPAWLALAWSKEGRAALDRDSGEAHAAEPKPPVWTIVRHPAVLRAILVVLASSPAMAFILMWGAKFLVHRFGVTQTDIGKYLWAPPLFFDVGAILFGDLASRRRDHDASPRALFAVAAVLACAIGLVPFARSAWPAVLVFGVAAAGVGALFALFTSDMLSRVPPRAVSLSGGITAAAQSLAYIVALPLIGWAVKRTGSYELALFTLAAWTLPGCVAWLLWPPPPRVGVRLV